MSKQRRGSGDPRKRNRADRKADRTRWQLEAARAGIEEIGEPPSGETGVVLYKVGPVALIETKLLPGAPASVRARYRDPDPRRRDRPVPTPSDAVARDR